MGFETVVCEITGSIATVTLNRPKVLNALNAQLFDELEAVFTALAADRRRAGYFADGSGREGFCCGGGYSGAGYVPMWNWGWLGAAGAGGVSTD